MSFTQTVLQHHRDCKVEHCRKLLRVELNKQNKEKAHLHHSSPRNDTDVLILLIIFYA